MIYSSRLRAVTLSAVCLAVALTFACSHSDSARVATSPSEGARASTASRDLSLDESAGGHVLKKHVGRTDDQLRQRLNQERNISAASTYTDRPTAEAAVGSALAANRDKIDHWLNRPGGHPNLVLDYDAQDGHPVGRTLHRGDDRSQPCSHALVVLRWAGGDQYYVLTSYPECR
jgi:Bacterial CdiA-CT RNAse A domain